jgi:hypothetical protein
MLVFALASHLRRAFSDFPDGRRGTRPKLICDNTDGLIVTGAGGKIIYANEAYFWRLPPRGGARSSGCFPGLPGSPRPYTARASRAGRQGECREVRLSPPLNSESEAGWYKIKVSPSHWEPGALLVVRRGRHARTGRRVPLFLRNCGTPLIFTMRSRFFPVAGTVKFPT